MKFEDPRFLTVGVCLGVLAAFWHAPLAFAAMAGCFLGLFFVPPFFFEKALNFWGSYAPANFETLKSILMERSNIPFQKAWVVVAALMLLATAAVLFGLAMAEFALPRWFGVSVLDRPPLSTAMVMVCVYALFKVLTWWAKRQQ